MTSLTRSLLAVAAALPAPSRGEGQPAAFDGRFGVMTHFAQGWDTDWIPVVGEAGISEVRDELYWKDVEPAKGSYRFPASYDRYLAGLSEARISPLIVLSFENPNYDGGATPYTSAGIEAYARYATEVLRHCGRQVRAVEIWNEYNGAFNHGPAGANRAAGYSRMLRAAYLAIKRERPDVIVVGGATSGIPLPYWERLMSAGALENMDALSVHPYRYGSPPEGIEADVAALERLVLKHNSGNPKPIWVTEIGWYLKPSRAPGDLLIDESVQAKFLVRAFALLLSADVQRTYWYLLRDYQDFTMGLVRDDPRRTRKPAFAAMQTLVQQLRGAAFVRRERTPDSLYSLLFLDGNGVERRVVWSLVPQSLAVRGATAVVDIRGESSAPGPVLRLDDSPLFVTGRLRGLPAPAGNQGVVLADSRLDFTDSAGGAWAYGTFTGADLAFAPLPTCELTDWKAAWTSSSLPSIEVSADGQHPSVLNGTPVAAVRRWRSNYEGRIRILARFRCSTQGDGVGVSFCVDGVRRIRRVLGGGAGVELALDTEEAVHRGTTLDFAVDPGPAADIDYDSTEVSIVIRSER